MSELTPLSSQHKLTQDKQFRATRHKKLIYNSLCYNPCVSHRNGKPSSSSSASDEGSNCRASISTTRFFSSNNAISCARACKAALLPIVLSPTPLLGIALALLCTSFTFCTPSVDTPVSVGKFVSLISVLCFG